MSNTVCRAPREAFDGVALRLVFATDPAVVADRVDEAEQEAVIDLARAGLVAAQVVGELHVGDLRQMRLDGVRELALHALHTIDVVLDVDVRRSGSANDVERLPRVRQPE